MLPNVTDNICAEIIIVATFTFTFTNVFVHSIAITAILCKNIWHRHGTGNGQQETVRETRLVAK
jgi:hypothetical protein